MNTLAIAELSTQQADFSAKLDALLDYTEREDARLQETVAQILQRVADEGDDAVVELTAELDAFSVASIDALVLSPDDLAAAFAAVPATERKALEHAHARIREYHERQVTTDLDYEDHLGNRLGQRWTAIERVGVYVPGGKAAYPSSVLMTVTPARVAGVDHVTLVVPTPSGERNPLLLAAAHLAGVDEVVTIGGAQAIAALAYGTNRIRKVDTIVGPGNAYVAAAKRQVFGRVGIDSIAGPSEVLVIADASVRPDWVALDLFSQAEHDEAAQSILISDDAAVLAQVKAEMQRLLAQQPRAEVIRSSLEQRGALILVADLEEACDVANRVAPEHLELMVADPEALLPRVRHAGAIFLGARTAEVLGDYVAGPSHVLPTYGTARFSSPLSVYDFKKRTSIIGISQAGVQELAPTAVTLAEAEGLIAHGAAADIRRGGND